MSNTFKINGLEYEAEFKLSNPDGKEIKFTKSAIRGMTIVDNIFDPFASGTISIANPYDYVENELLLRGDGRDEFYINFKVKDSEEGYEQTFAIISDSDTVNPLVRSENIKTFALVDKNAIPFSDKIPHGVFYNGKVGDVLKGIFKKILGEDLVSEEEWESGDFELEYHPPSTYRYIDIVHELLKIFYAKDGDLYTKGFISWDSKDKKFKMKLLSKIFEKNKDLLIEGFSVGDLTTSIDTNNPNNPMSEADVGQYIAHLKNLGYSTPFYGWNTDYFVNSIIYGYDHTLGFQKFKKVKIEDVKKKWVKKFVDVFKSSGGKPKEYFVKNKTLDQKFRKYSFPYPVEDSAAMVEADMINSLTFLNLQLSFSNIGRVERQSGKFIDIFTTRGDNNIKSDQKILGRWYITEMRHIFFGDLYTNQLMCCKTYVGPNANIKDDVD